MSYDLERRYQPERRDVTRIRWFRERRYGFDRRQRAEGAKA